MPTNSQKKSSRSRVEAQEILLGSKMANFLLAFQILLTMLALLQAVMLMYYTKNGLVDYIGRISFTSFDPPWVPTGFDSKPIFGFHYFGDWVLQLAYGGLKEPYSPSLNIPAQFAPIGIITNSFFYIFGLKVGYIVFSVITLILWVKVINWFLPRRNLVEKVCILFFIVLFTAPSLIAIDRGGSQLFCVGLIANSYIWLKSKNYVKSFLSFLIAVSLKTYLVLMPLVFLLNNQNDFKSKIQQIFKVLTTTFVLNLLFLPLYCNNIIVGLRDEFAATSKFAGHWGIPWIVDGASITSFISKTVEFFQGTEEALKFLKFFLPMYPKYIALALLIVLLIICLSPRVGYQTKTLLILSTTSLLSPFSGPYTLVWASLAFIYLVSELDNGFRPKELPLLEKSVFYSFVIALFFALTPYFGTFHMPSGATRHNPGNYFYMPFVLFTFVVTVIQVLIGFFSNPNNRIVRTRSVLNGKHSS